MDLQTLFENYQKEAFRLEILPQYKIEGEWELFLEFKASGKILPDEEFDSYVRDASKKIKSGARHIRARVLDTPLTEYENFEIQSGYFPLVSAGSEVVYIIREDFTTLIFEEFGNNFIPKDFWLFDNKYLVLMNYNKSGEWLGFQLIDDDNVINLYSKLRVLLLLNCAKFESLKV